MKNEEDQQLKETHKRLLGIAIEVVEETTPKLEKEENFTAFVISVYECLASSLFHKARIQTQQNTMKSANSLINKVLGGRNENI